MVDWTRGKFGETPCPGLPLHQNTRGLWCIHIQQRTQRIAHLENQYAQRGVNSGILQIHRGPPPELPLGAAAAAVHAVLKRPTSSE
jgi:hypothetical protein